MCLKKNNEELVSKNGTTKAYQFGHLNIGQGNTRMFVDLETGVKIERFQEFLEQGAFFPFDKVRAAEKKKIFFFWFGELSNQQVRYRHWAMTSWSSNTVLK